MQAGQKREKRGGSRPFSQSRVPASSDSGALDLGASDKPLLRLALARGSLALELDAEVMLGPIAVGALSVLLPDVRFPVDLTGGVTKFRHRRGTFASATVYAKTETLARHFAPKLRGLIGSGTPEMVVAPSASGALVGIASGASAIAFEVLLAPMGQDLRIILEAPRGIGLGAPAFVVALRALTSLLKSVAVRRGDMFVIENAAGEVARRVFPEAGARAPQVRGVEMEISKPEARSIITISAREGAPPPALDRRVLRGLELSDLVGDCDDLAVGGDLEGARAGYLAALERAPRHPDISLRLAAVDITLGDRAEAALGTVVEAMSAIEAGTIGGELLLAVGDSEAAYAAFARAATDEPYGPLAALTWIAAARASTDRSLLIAALDAALVRSPGNIDARWERLAARLATGEVRGAVGDAEHIEAATQGASSRHAAALRAGRLFADRGYTSEAATRFERALRYSPSSPEAVLGLARALRDMGRAARALDLFARAAALAERKGTPSPSCELELARSLAEHARDLPAAIARVARVPQQSPETFEARLMEGRWRAELGDLTGAARALGRLREAAEIHSGLTSDRGLISRWLLEAAGIDEREIGDLHAAHRDLALGLRLTPRDGEIATDLRRVSRLLASVPSDDEAVAPRAPVPVRPPSVAVFDSAPDPREMGSKVSFEVANVADAASIDGDEPDESQLEELTAKLRANPNDHAIALLLARLLTALGRDLELLALLSARIEEGDDAARADLVPMRRDVLDRLARAARDEGRASEAEIYELMRDAEE